MSGDEWTTKVELDEMTCPYGFEKPHKVAFEPIGGRRCRSVAALLPECETRVIADSALLERPELEGKIMAMVNRPPGVSPTDNRIIEAWLRGVCRGVTELGTQLWLLCDTAEQTKHYAKKATKLLPKHRRMAIERAGAQVH